MAGTTVATSGLGRTRSETVLIPEPVYRRLRGYAFDPSLSSRLDTAVINETVYRVPWEEAGPPGTDDGLSPGPVGEYLEIVDYDPASGLFYEPLDLDDPHVLAQDGLPPSEGSPQFHQQMVYAVAMTTIQNFERALGRRALWAPRRPEIPGRNDEFVRRLRVYPHALREANAYYSPDKKALLFGYFPASTDQPGRFLPGGLVFTCLSHDIIAHETTHALLDGMHGRFIEANHPDALAFHEAFADLVALFQHFSNPDVLRHQIARTRGDLASQNLLGELAQQFGESIGNYGALRSALGRHNPKTGEWEPQQPNPDDYQAVEEPHDRGAILVAAVFEGFLAIYKRRVADLLRIATSGTGVLPAGDLHPDLVNRLASEAAKSAQHVLNMCVRALDYCPPVDISFGDYLRAVITADADLVPDDDLGYRIAIMEGFRRRGIYPRDIRALSPESLRWPTPDRSKNFFEPLKDQVRTLVREFSYLETRRDVYERTQKAAADLHKWISNEGRHALSEFGELAGIQFKLGLEGIRESRRYPGAPAFQVHSLRPAQRVGPDNDSLNQLIISMIQTRVVPLDPDVEGSEMINFRGGCTLILDLESLKLRYAISKRVDDPARLERQRQHHRGLETDGSPRATYFGKIKDADEPLAMLHRSYHHGRP